MNEQTSETPVYDLTSKTGKKYRLIYDEAGRELWEYEPKPGLNAPIYDPEKRQLIKGSAPVITSETAADMVVIRDAKNYALKVEGVKRALIRNGKYVDKLSQLTDEQAITAVMDAVTDHAIDKYAPGSAHVKGQLLNALDMMPDKRRKEEDAPPGTVRLTVTTTIQELRKHMEDKYRDAVDGEVTDVG